MANKPRCKECNHPMGNRKQYNKTSKKTGNITAKKPVCECDCHRKE